MEKLGALDATFLYLESREQPMHVGAVQLFELPDEFRGSFHAAFKDHIRERLHLAAPMTRRLKWMPFSLDHPAWVSCPEVDLDEHVHHVSLPAPGTMRQLETLVERLHALPLVRSRPLFEYYVIDGLESGQAALYGKFHHCGLDGAAGVALTKALYDISPEPRKVEPPKRPLTRETVGVASLLTSAAASIGSQPVRVLRGTPALGRGVVSLLRRLVYGSDTLLPFNAPRTRFNRRITKDRAYRTMQLSFGEVRSVAKASETTINDVALAISAGALRRYLQDHGELPEKSLTAMAPVSLRSGDNKAMNNQVTSVFVELATEYDKPLARLEAIKTHMAAAKTSVQGAGTFIPQEFSLPGLPILFNALGSAIGRLSDVAPPAANVAISNVPGSPLPLYLAGARMVGNYPVSIVAHGAGLNITLQSNVETLDFGIIAARRLMPDLDVLVRYMDEEFAVLKKAVFGRKPRVVGGTDRKTPKRPVAPKARNSKPASLLALAAD